MIPVCINVTTIKRRRKETKNKEIAYRALRSYFVGPFFH